MSENKRFTIDVWDRDLYFANIEMALIGLIFYHFFPGVDVLFIALGAIIFLNFCLWLYCVRKGRY